VRWYRQEIRQICEICLAIMPRNLIRGSKGVSGGFESVVGEVLKWRVQLALGRSVSVFLNV